MESSANSIYEHNLTKIYLYSLYVIVYSNHPLMNRSILKNSLNIFFSKEYRPYGYTYRCRDAIDRPNGVIGQAHVIKALAEAGIALRNDSCKKLAEELFLLHPFDEKEGLWYRVDIDGKNLGKDYTLNHQMCFAAYSLSLLPFASSEVKRRLDIFMDKLDLNMKLRKNGQIVHVVEPKNMLLKIKYSFLNTYNYFFYKKGHYQTKEPGYMAFNMTLLSLLYRIYKNHSFFKSKKMSSALDYFISEDYEYKVNIKKEPFFFVNGKIHLALTLETFHPGETNRIIRLLKEDLTEYYKYDGFKINEKNSSNSLLELLYLLTLFERDYDLNIKK